MPVHLLKSMTGYAQARVEQNGWTLSVSLRSVNHRFLDIHLRLPEGFETFEPSIRQTVRDRIRRGHVDVTVHYEPAGPAAVHVHKDVAAAYLTAANEIRKQFGLQSEPELAAILRLPGVIGSAEMASEDEVEQLGASVKACLDEALGKLEEMRRSEGRHLVEDMTGRLRAITENAKRIAELLERVRPAYAHRLETRLRELLGATPVDPARIVQEAAVLAERGDISEEISRLHSHVQQFEKHLNGSGEAGKKLDFLLQEMQREANTMLSKTPGVETDGLAITDLALEIKSLIEKLREQVQNVE